jgi:hypothetical protein
LEDKQCTSTTEWVAKFRIAADGGVAPYTYYRDIERICGPTDERVCVYELKYGAKAAAVGTFFVESDGERAEKGFWVPHPDCTTFGS